MKPQSLFSFVFTAFTFVAFATPASAALTCETLFGNGLDLAQYISTNNKRAYSYKKSDTGVVQESMYADGLMQGRTISIRVIETEGPGATGEVKTITGVIANVYTNGFDIIGIDGNLHFISSRTHIVKAALMRQLTTAETQAYKANNDKSLYYSSVENIGTSRLETAFTTSETSPDKFYLRIKGKDGRVYFGQGNGFGNQGDTKVFILDMFDGRTKFFNESEIAELGFLTRTSAEITVAELDAYMKDSVEFGNTVLLPIEGGRSQTFQVIKAVDSPQTGRTFYYLKSLDASKTPIQKISSVELAKVPWLVVTSKPTLLLLPAGK